MCIRDRDKGVTSLQKELGNEVQMEEVKERLWKELVNLLSWTIWHISVSYTHLGLKDFHTDLKTKTVTITYDADKTNVEKLKKVFQKFHYEAEFVKETKQDDKK